MTVIPLKDAEEFLIDMEPKILFSDIDGTLVGRNGSLFSSLDGEPIFEAAQALFSAHLNGLKIILVSGRDKTSVMEVNRLLGISDAITEMGTCLVVNGNVEFLWGNVPLDIADTPALVMQQAGALDLLLEHYKGQLEPHEAIPQRRQGTILLRGQIPIDEANIFLVEQGFEWATLINNGRFNRHFSHLGPGRTHAYHLAPKGVDKSVAVQTYLERQGLLKKHAAAIGDSPSDLELVDQVGAMFMVSNGSWAINMNEKRSIILTDQNAGLGWAEVISLLISLRKKTLSNLR